jgi:DNA mismatch endonuclease, patch repair protein
VATARTPRTRSQVSAIMRRVRRSGTDAELAVRSALRSLGVYVRTNNHRLPGTPDVSNARLRLAVFVHGCFWHQHEGCRRASTPASNREFWRTKFSRNKERDALVIRRLRDMGYTVVVVWRCELRDPARVLKRLRGALRRCEHSPRRSSPLARIVKAGT